MKILVTGSSGFIAANLIPFLKAKGHIVLGVDKESGPYTDYQMDISDLSEVMSPLIDCDALIHLSAFGGVGPCQLNPFQAYDNDLGRAIELFNYCNHIGLSNIIVASSAGAVYGNFNRACKERDLPRPISIYGAIKASLELMALSYRALSPKVLRFSNVFGPGMDKKQGLITRLARGGPIDLRGDGNQSRDFIHVSHVCEAIASALNFPDPCTFNISSGRSLTVNQVIAAYEEASGHSVEIRTFKHPTYEVYWSQVDNYLARQCLGLEPKIMLEDYFNDLSKSD